MKGRSMVGTFRLAIVKPFMALSNAFTGGVRGLGSKRAGGGVSLCMLSSCWKKPYDALLCMQRM